MHNKLYTIDKIFELTEQSKNILSNSFVLLILKFKYLYGIEKTL